MTGSCLTLVSARAIRPIIAPRRRSLRLPLSSLSSTLVAAACMTGAFLLAPEQPEQQASICERHQSVAACRVW